jgi:hypothetical protein
LNSGSGSFRDVAPAIGSEFSAPKVARGIAYGDFDRDGDLDVLITTNQGPAHLYRNDVTNGNKSLRLRLIGAKSNRDGIGSLVRVFTPEGAQSRMVKSGSSYLSQSELTLTFGLGKRETVNRIVIEWPSGVTQEFKNVHAGSYECVESKNLEPATRS